MESSSALKDFECYLIYVMGVSSLNATLGFMLMSSLANK